MLDQRGRSADKLMSQGGPKLASTHPKIKYPFENIKIKEGWGRGREQDQHKSKISLSEFNTCGVLCISLGGWRVRACKKGFIDLK